MRPRDWRLCRPSSNITRSPSIPPTHPARNLSSAGQYYSDQPPVFAIILSGVYWIMMRLGSNLDQTPALAAYLLTLIGTTLPVAWTAALVYRMGRLFELPRIWRGTFDRIGFRNRTSQLRDRPQRPHAPAATALLAAVGAWCMSHRARNRSAAADGS